MVPELQLGWVDIKGWATEDELMDYYASGRCTPSSIAVNTATFVGYKFKGIVGGFAATFWVVFPSRIIITVIATFIRNFADLAIVGHALNGIQVCVCALILDAVISLSKKSIVDRYSLIIFLLVFFLSLFTNLSTLILIFCSGVIGYLIGRFLRKKEGL